MQLFQLSFIHNPFGFRKAITRAATIPTLIPNNLIHEYFTLTYFDDCDSFDDEVRGDVNDSFVVDFDLVFLQNEYFSC